MLLYMINQFPLNYPLINSDFYSDSDSNSESDTDSEIYPSYLIDTFTLHPYYPQEYDQTILALIYQLLEILEEKLQSKYQKPLEQIKRKPYEKIINIKDTIEIFNKILEQIIQLHNNFIDIINKIPEINKTIQKIHFKPIILNNYNFPLNQNLINFIVNLRTKIFSIYDDVINMAKILSKVKSSDEINAQINNHLRKLGLMQ
jgi:hypothetical protein